MIYMNQLPVVLNYFLLILTLGSTFVFGVPIASINLNNTTGDDTGDPNLEILKSIIRMESKLESIIKQTFAPCEEKEIQDCEDIKKRGIFKNGKYEVCLFGDLISIYCDFESPDGPYLVFQRRIDGSTNFFRSFVSYSKGFGDVNKEFWLGLETIHKYTTNEKYSLRIDLGDFYFNRKYAIYSNFSVSSAASNYTLSVKNYSGDAGDSFGPHNTSPFSTYDRERDYTLNCARNNLGAWWYGRCLICNLNGMYFEGETNQINSGVVWADWRGYQYSLKMTEMKMRRK